MIMIGLFFSTVDCFREHNLQQMKQMGNHGRNHHVMGSGPLHPEPRYQTGEPPCATLQLNLMLWPFRCFWGSLWWLQVRQLCLKQPEWPIQGLLKTFTSIFHVERGASVCDSHPASMGSNPLKYQSDFREQCSKEQPRTCNWVLPNRT